MLIERISFYIYVQDASCDSSMDRFTVVHLLVQFFSSLLCEEKK